MQHWDDQDGPSIDHLARKSGRVDTGRAESIVTCHIL